MRVSQGDLRQMHREERGAVVMIVAISLVVLLGMLVLTVDLGGLVATRRAMVRAADSAALAVAQACAGNPTQSPGTPESYADTYAIANVDLATLDSSATNIVEFGAIVGNGSGGFTYVPGVNNCQNGLPGYVRVSYTGTQDMFFARIWGSSTGDVAGTATAIWARTNNPAFVPWVVSEPIWLACLADPLNQPCVFEFPPPGAGNPNWGIMDWDTWALSPDGTPLRVNECGISSGNPTWDPLWAGEVRLDPEPPQWVCFDNGLQYSDEWERLEGGTWAFPIADQIDDNQPPDADMGHIIDWGCMSVPVNGVNKQGSKVFITMVPEDTCFVQGDIDLEELGLGPMGTKLVE